MGTFNEKLIKNKYEETWWTIKFLKYYGRTIPSILAFSSAALQAALGDSTKLCFSSTTKTKRERILIKRKCHRARCDSRWCVMSKAFERLIETSRMKFKFSFPFFAVRSPFHEKPFMFYVFRSLILETRQLVLTCASGDEASDLKTIIVIHSRLSLWNETRLLTQSWSWKEFFFFRSRR